MAKTRRGPSPAPAPALLLSCVPRNTPEGGVELVATFEDSPEQAVLAAFAPSSALLPPWAMHEAAHAAARAILLSCQQAWRRHRGVPHRTALARIRYDTQHTSGVYAYLGVEMLLDGAEEAVDFATGDPVRDWRQAASWAVRHADRVVRSSSIDAFVRNTPALAFDAAGDIVHSS
jgi:hypothetical protein